MDGMFIFVYLINVYFTLINFEIEDIRDQLKRFKYSKVSFHALVITLKAKIKYVMGLYR